MSRLLRLLSLGMLTLLVAGSASATTLLQEDFNDGVADGFTPLSGDWYVEGGSYHCLVEGTNLAYSTFAGDSSWTDYDFRGRVRVDGGVANILRFRSDGLISRGQGNGYELDVRYGTYRDVWLFSWVNGTRRFLSSHDQVAFLAGPWHDFEIYCQGSQIVVYWDGENILTYNDSGSANLSGGVELMAYIGGDTDHQLASYDDIVVEASTTTGVDVAQEDFPVLQSNWSALKALY